MAETYLFVNLIHFLGYKIASSSHDIKLIVIQYYSSTRHTIWVKKHKTFERINKLIAIHVCLKSLSEEHIRSKKKFALKGI